MSDLPKHPADPANEFASDNSPIDPRDFRNALGTFGTGVTIVTAMSADGKPYGVTCNSFASVSLNPPLVLWSLGMFSQGLPVFQNASHFTVNVLDVSQQELALKFAKSSGEKFNGVEWKPGLGNAPVIAGTRGAIPVPRSEPLLRRRPHHLPRRGRGLSPTTGRSRCCLRAAVSASSSATANSAELLSSPSRRDTSRRSRSPSSAPRRHGR